MNKVIVNITSTQKTGSNISTNTITTKNVANHHRKNGTSYIIYKEKIIDDKPAVDTMLKLTDSSLTVTRSGQIKSQQYFAKGSNHESEYKTPFGDLKIEVKTQGFKSSPLKEFTDDSIYRKIEIDYVVYSNGKWQSDNKLIIDICPAN